MKPSRAKAATRLGDFSESVIREQTRMAMEHGAINLAQGFPDFPCPPALKKLANEALSDDHNQYSITWGLPGLRKAIAAKAKRYNGIHADPETEVTVTCGSTEAMICAFLGLIDPGREVILFQPFYENYHPDSYLSGAKPVHVSLRAPDWQIDETELRKAFGPKTAAIVITTPHNPTGKVFSRAELEWISRLCQKWGVLVFCDEIYEHILYEGARHVSPASVPGLEDRTVTLNSASKTYGVTGWRVGWAIAPQPLTQSLRKVHDFLTVCAATPLQVAVAGALELPVFLLPHSGNGIPGAAGFSNRGARKRGVPLFQAARRVLCDGRSRKIPGPEDEGRHGAGETPGVESRRGGGAGFVVLLAGPEGREKRSAAVLLLQEKGNAEGGGGEAEALRLLTGFFR